MELLAKDDYELIASLVYEHSRINLGDAKGELVASRVSKRIRALNLGGYGDYCALLRSGGGTEELGNLVDVISTNHTSFYREKRHFEFLESEALPRMVEVFRRNGEKTFRLWCAASASGEEPYTLAIVLAEFFERVPDMDWEIEASDISTRILAKARQAVYAEDRVSAVPQPLLRKYFQKGTGEWTGHYRAKASLRDKVRFTRVNLLQERYPFTKPFGVIFCRNVMIYFDRPTQQTLVAKLAADLVSGGYLMVGHSESLTGIQHSLKGVHPATYRKA